MYDVIPSHYRVQNMESRTVDPRGFTGMYAGEVIAVIYPDDKKSLTKKFIEYRVMAQAVHNGATAVLEFPHAIVMSSLAGFADYSTWTFRADPATKNKDEKLAFGSRVIVMCINGDFNNAVIVGGIRDHRDTTEEKAQAAPLGHHLTFTFNGVTVNIDKDGQLKLTRLGPTKPDGTLNTEDKELSPKVGKSTAAQVGATVTLDADGGIEVATTVAPEKAGDPRKVEQRVKLDHKTKKISIEAKSGADVIVLKGDVKVTATEGNVTLSAPKGKIMLGEGAGEPILLGDKTGDFLGQLLKAIQALKFTNAGGPTSPPLNIADFIKLEQKISSLKSEASFVKKKP